MESLAKIFIIITHTHSEWKATEIMHWLGDHILPGILTSYDSWLIKYIYHGKIHLNCFNLLFILKLLGVIIFY